MNKLFNRSPVDLFRLCTYLTGGALGVLVTALSAAFPSRAVQFAAIAGIIIFVAGFVTNVFANPTNKPARSIVAGATIVPAGTTDVTPSTPVIGVNSHNPPI